MMDAVSFTKNRIGLLCFAISVSLSFAQSSVLAQATGKASSAEPEPTEAEAEALAKNTVTDGSLTFTQQLQEYFQTAKDAGATTAGSAADWLADQYEYATNSASETSKGVTNWVNDQYSSALKAGDTTATTAKTWVLDDLGKIGTWEYKVYKARSSTATSEELNDLGKKRWECFAVVLNPKTLKSFYYFKRPHRSYLQQLPAKELLRLAPLMDLGAPEEK